MHMDKQFLAVFSMHINLISCIVQHTHQHTAVCIGNGPESSVDKLFVAMFSMPISADSCIVQLPHQHMIPGMVQAVMDGLDSVEVAPAKTEGDSQSSYAAEEQLWRHEFFRDCLAPKKAAFKVDGSPCQHPPVHNPSTLARS